MPRRVTALRQPLDGSLPQRWALSRLHSGFVGLSMMGGLLMGAAAAV